MTIHQAYFGDKDKSHNLLCSSIDHSQLIGWLKLNTNPQSDAEYAHLSGAMVGDFYVFTKTIKDRTAERGGMEFSHCLILPPDAIEHISQLSEIFSHFVKTPQKEVDSLSPICLDTKNNDTEETPPPNFEQVVDALLRNEQTVVYAGYENFEENIKSLWKTLPFELRKKLSFIIADRPNDLPNDDYTLVHVPKEFLSNWRGFSLVSENPIVERSSALELLVNPKSDIAAPLQSFIKENQIPIEGFSDISAIVKLQELVEQVKISGDVKTLKRVINYLNKIIPKPNQGKELKTSVLNQFAQSIKTATFTEFKMLRNMSLTDFQSKQKAVTNSASQWVTKKLIPQNSSLPTSDIIELLIEGYWGGAKDWWKKMVQDRFRSICKNLTEEVVNFIWNLWAKDKRFIAIVGQITDDSKEDLFIENAPESGKELFANLLQFSLNKKWYLLYALASIKSMTMMEAIKAQLKNAPTKYIKKRLSLIAKEGTPAEFIRIATTISHTALHEIAGKFCAKNAAYLVPLDVTNIHWQNVWYQSYLINQDIRHGVAKPQEQLFQLLDLLISEKTVEPKLLKILADNLGNIFDYSNRKEIWSLLDNSIKQSFLHPTALNVVENSESIDILSLEKLLLQYLQSSQFIKAEILDYSKLSILQKLKFLANMRILEQGYIIEVLNNHGHQINQIEGTYIANQIKKNDWKKLLNIIDKNRYKNRIYPTIISVRVEMFGLVRRLAIENDLYDVDISKLMGLIDNGQFQKLFEILKKMGLNDSRFNRLRDEYVGGLQGIEYNDYCERLKIYIGSLDSGVT